MHKMPFSPCLTKYRRKFAKYQFGFFKKSGFAKNVNRTMSLDVGDGYGVQRKRFLELKNEWKIWKLY